MSNYKYVILNHDNFNRSWHLNIIDVFKAFFCTVVMIISFLVVFYSWASLPIVYTSMSTGLCVGVLINGVEYPCSYLKDHNIKKYERIFVK